MCICYAASNSFIDEIAHVITKTDNKSLSTVYLSISLNIGNGHASSFKKKHVKCRPFSDLSSYFLNNTIERALTCRLLSYLRHNSLLEEMEPAYKQVLSTEIAVLHIKSDILNALDNIMLSLSYLIFPLHWNICLDIFIHILQYTLCIW